MRRPEETSRWFAQTADGIMAEVAAAEKTIRFDANNEFRSTETDLRILAGLARYHSWRLLGGVSYNLYKQSGDLHAFDDAIADERQALQAWNQIVAAAGDVYSDQLAFGAHAVQFSRHWKEEYSLLGRDFENLLAERAGAKPNAGGKHYLPLSAQSAPPVAQLFSDKSAKLNTDYVVSANVMAPAGVKSVRLRYRHLTQVEDYQTADMVLDANTGKYVGRIPAAFISPKWDLMYFVETIGKNHSGRMYPDADSETPYVVATVER